MVTVPAADPTELLYRYAVLLGRIEVLLSDADAVWYSDREAAHLRVLRALRIARGEAAETDEEYVARVERDPVGYFPAADAVAAKMVLVQEIRATRDRLDRAGEALAAPEEPPARD